MEKPATPLEKQPWRTTQRENPADYEQRATAGKWALILGAIVRYQNRNQGASPTDLMISMDCKLSPGTVAYQLKQMEKAGLLTDNRRTNSQWTIDLSATAKVAGPDELKKVMKPKLKKVEEVKTMDTNEFKTGTKKEREDFFTIAQKVAREIVDQTYARGEPPLMKHIAKPLGYKHPASCNEIMRKMVERGWLTHGKGRHNDIKVTGLGRTALLDNGQPRPETRAAPPYMEVRRAAPPPEEAAPTPSSPIIEKPQLAITPATLSSIDTVDLLLELQSRGLKVSR